jgi:hypothetical protein
MYKAKGLMRKEEESLLFKGLENTLRRRRCGSITTLGLGLLDYVDELNEGTLTEATADWVLWFYAPFWPKEMTQQLLLAASSAVAEKFLRAGLSP